MTNPPEPPVNDEASGPTVTIAGRYELSDLLGRGGMAEVRKATDLRLGRVVAVKRLRTDLAGDPTFQERFRREAHASAKLNHPSIVAVYDTGQEPATDGQGPDQPFIVMEYVQGRTLREILREGRKILPGRALEIGSEVLDALDYSHRAGIIHRDIKPGNVMLTRAGDVKVMDFGIARAISDASSSMTQTAAVVGTAQYLSPEQARGETVDSRSDVYSAGCLIYELLTGRPPFVGDSPVAVAYQHVREPAVPPSSIESDLSPTIDAILLKALAKPVEDRYQSAAEMRADIERYLAGSPVTTVAPPQPVAAPPAGATTVIPTTGVYRAGPAPSPYDDEPDHGGRRFVIGTVIALALALIVGAVFVLPQMFAGGPERVQTPKITGKSQAAAEVALIDANLLLGQVTLVFSDQPEGQVVSQDPAANEWTDEGTKVNVEVSQGQELVEVPFVINGTQAQARKALNKANLKPVFEDVESDLDPGTVVSTDPAAGEEVPIGSDVTVSIASGPEEVLNVVGFTEAQATEVLGASDWNVDVEQSFEPTDAPLGQVVKQYPEAGTPWPKDRDVIIYVNAYEAPTDPTDGPTDGVTPRPMVSTPPATRRALRRRARG